MAQSKETADLVSMYSISTSSKHSLNMVKIHYAVYVACTALTFILIMNASQAEP